MDSSVGSNSGYNISTNIPHDFGEVTTAVLDVPTTTSTQDNTTSAYTDSAPEPALSLPSPIDEVKELEEAYTAENHASENDLFVGMTFSFAAE